MKNLFWCLLTLLASQNGAAATVTVNYKASDVIGEVVAYGMFQYDTIDSLDSRYLSNEAVYYPNSSFFSLYLPATNYSYTGSISYIIVGNNVINSISPSPYDSFEIGVQNRSTQARIILEDFSGSIFAADSLPFSLSLKEFGYSQFVTSFPINRSLPLVSMTTVPLPASLFLLVSALGGFGLLRAGSPKRMSR